MIDNLEQIGQIIIDGEDKAEIDLSNGKWEKACPKESTKGASTQFSNTRKAVNLFDLSACSNDVYLGEDGSLNPTKGDQVSDFIPVEPNTTYHLTVTGSRRGKFYGANKQVLQSDTFDFGTASADATFTTTSDTCYIRFGMSGQVYDRTKIILNEGSTALSYYPYFSPTQVCSSIKCFGGQIQEIAPNTLFGRYKPVEYIKTTNQQKNQSSTLDCAFIDTKYIPTTKTIIRCDMSFDNVATNSNEALIGVSILGRFAWGFANVSPTTNFYFGLHDINKVSTAARDSLRHIFKISSPEDKWYLDDASGLFNSDFSYNTESSIYLFARNSGAGATNANRPVDATLYSFKIWEDSETDDNLTMCLVPVLDTVTNKYGLFDTVGEKFYGTKGTSDFIGSPEIKRVECIKSSSTQYIDTGIKYSGNHSIEIKEYRTAGSSNSVFGVNPLVALTNTTSTRRVRYNNVTYDSQPLGTMITTKLDKNLLYYDGELVKTFTKASFTSSYSAVLFARRVESTGGIEENGDACVCYCKLWDNGTLVRDFIPVLLGTEYAMFDLVEWKVYRNAGTGEFTGGEIIPDRLLNPYDLKSNVGTIRYGYDDGIVIPSEYERVEYLQHDGNNSWIETGIYANQSTMIEVVAQLTQSTGNIAVLGARDTSDGYKSSYTIWGKVNDKARFDYNTSQISSSVGIGTDEHVYKKVGVKNYLDGVQLSDNTAPTFTTPVSLNLFRVNGQTPTTCVAGTRIYSCIIAADGTKIDRHFIPVKKVSNNEYGMYDTVSKQFYGNSGTGLFTGGNVVNKRLICDGSHLITTYTNLAFNEHHNQQLSQTDGVTFTVNTSVNVTNYIKVKNRTLFIGGATTGQAKVFKYGQNHTFIDADTLVHFGTSISFDSSAEYIRLQYNYTLVKTENIMVTIGTTAVPHLPYIEPIEVEVTDILPSATSYIDEQTGTLYNDWNVIWYDGTQTIPGSYISQTGDLTPNQIVAYELSTPITEIKTTTPVALTTKGNKTISSTAEIPVSVQATVLSK